MAIVLALVRSTRKHAEAVLARVPKIEVARVSVALSAKARVQLQRRLTVIAEKFDEHSEAERHRTLMSVLVLLQKYSASFEYGYRESDRVDEADAEQTFTERVRSLRERYDYDTVKRTGVRPEALRAHSEEGPGLVVVSLVIASTKKLTEPRAIRGSWDAHGAITEALQQLRGATPQSLIALEVLWSPSVDEDRLSSAELEVLYPELVALRPERTGRERCEHCDCIYAKELGGCPVCGSTLSKHEKARSNEKPSSAHVRPCVHCKLPVLSYEVQCHSCGSRAQPKR